MTLPSLRASWQVAAIAGAVAFALPSFADPTPNAAPSAPQRAHHRHAGHRHALAANGAIRPLTPASHPAIADGGAAPMPNRSVTRPVDNSDQVTSVAPAVMQIHYPPQGDGYTTGSSAQAMDDREAAKVTGVQVHVPLGQ